MQQVRKKYTMNKCTQHERVHTCVHADEMREVYWRERKTQQAWKVEDTGKWDAYPN